VGHVVRLRYNMPLLELCNYIIYFYELYHKKKVNKDWESMFELCCELLVLSNSKNSFILFEKGYILVCLVYIFLEDHITFLAVIWWCYNVPTNGAYCHISLPFVSGYIEKKKGILNYLKPLNCTRRGKWMWEKNDYLKPKWIYTN